MLFGIDYGSKMAGTTVVASLEKDQVELFSAAKKQDADIFISQLVEEKEPELIGIDAPLSLPAVYHENGDDYFYRQCDKELKAMSPMFLGGLTARAMKLKANLGIAMVEVYPGALARDLQLNRFDYKLKEADYAEMISLLHWDANLERMPENSHEFDSILALYITWKLENDQALQVGRLDEGLIYY